MTNVQKTNQAALTKEQIAAQKLAEAKADAKAESRTTNRRLWDELCITNPKYIKDFNNGSYKGKSITPMYVFQRLTETFGPQGQGWGWDVLARWTEGFAGTTDMLCFVEVRGWYVENGQKFETSSQIAGEKLAYTTSKGRYVIDDEAYKKAITDGATKCFTYLGSSADVHLGQHDDSKLAMRVAQASFENEDAIKQARLRKKQAEVAAIAATLDVPDDIQDDVQQSFQDIENQVDQYVDNAEQEVEPVFEPAMQVEPPAQFVAQVANALGNKARLERAKEYAKTQYQGAELSAAFAYVDACIAQC